MLRFFNLASLYIRYRKLIKTTNSVHNINIMYKMGSFLSLIYAQKNCFTIFTSTSFTSSCQTLIKYIKYKKVEKRSTKLDLFLTKMTHKDKIRNRNYYIKRLFIIHYLTYSWN